MAKLWKVGLLLCGACARTPPAPAPARLTELPSSIVACGQDVALPLGLPAQSSTLAGHDRLRTGCARAPARECGYTLRVPTRSELRASLETFDFDGVLALHDARGAELSCVDDTPLGDSHHARIEATLEPGEYRLIVEGATGDGGQFSLFAELDPLPPPREACAAARTLVPGVSLRGSTRGGANQFSARCAGGAEGPDRVHRFELAEPSRVRVRQHSEHDGALHLRARCEDPESELACNDDVADSTRSIVTAELPAGEYYVISDSFGRGQSGDYVLSLERADLPSKRSVDEVCAEAELPALSPGEWELDTLDAPSVLAGSCGGEGAPERLFRLDLAEETTVLLDLLFPEFNAVLYVRVECADERSELQCIRASRVSGGGSRDKAARTLTATIGPGRYVVGVDGHTAADMGAARLRVRYVPMSVAQ